MSKVAVITGTGSGIGKSLAELLLKKKYVVFGYSRKNNIKHENFHFTKIDLSNLKNVKNIKLPKLKNKKITLINNAATIGEIIPIFHKKEEDIIKEYNLNIITPTILSKKIINKYFDLNKTIINISSGAANKSIPSWSTYCATKSALDRFTDTISKENIPNLNVYSVHPGIVDTEMQKNIRESKLEHFPLKEKFVEYYKTNQLEDPQTIAQKIYLIIKNPSNFCEKILSVRNIELN